MFNFKEAHWLFVHLLHYLEPFAKFFGTGDTCRTNLMKLRSQYKGASCERHGVKLRLMSGFIKAAVSALHHQPVVNAVIDGDNIYRDYVNISIDVGTSKGLVVPVIRDANKMNSTEIEKTINTLGKKANEGTISNDEMAGGSFTVSNDGVYGSLIITLIINPPQRIGLIRGCLTGFQCRGPHEDPK